jgi:hypothetical protein
MNPQAGPPENDPLVSILSARQDCIFQGVISHQCRCHCGVPQGSVISPQLFNFFVADFPNCTQIDVSFADDFSLSESSPDLDELGRKLTEHVEHVTQWAEKNKLAIEPTKSQSPYLFQTRKK